VTDREGWAKVDDTPVEIATIYLESTRMYFGGRRYDRGNRIVRGA